MPNKSNEEFIVNHYGVVDFQARMAAKRYSTSSEAKTTNSVPFVEKLRKSLANWKTLGDGATIRSRSSSVSSSKSTTAPPQQFWW